MSEESLVKTQEEKIHNAITHPDAMTQLIAEVRTRVSAFEPDMTTAKGRDSIKSFAHQITKTKTAIQKATKAYLANTKAKIKVIEATVKSAATEFDEIKAEVRLNLTKWEDEHKEAKRIVDKLRKLVVGMTGLETSKDVLRVIEELYKFDPNLVVEDERAKAIEVAKAIDSQLNQLYAKLIKQEKDAAELARLKQAEDIRVAKEAEAQRKKELDKAMELENKENVTEVEGEFGRATVEEADVLPPVGGTVHSTLPGSGTPFIDTLCADETDEMSLSDLTEHTAKLIEEETAEDNLPGIPLPKAKPAYPELAQAHLEEAVNFFVNNGLVKPQAIKMVKLVAQGEVPHIRMV